MNAPVLPFGVAPAGTSTVPPAWPEGGRTVRLLGGLVVLYGAAVAGALATAAVRNGAVAGAWASGVAGVVLASLLLPMTALLATLPLCHARASLGTPGTLSERVERPTWLRRVLPRQVGSLTWLARRLQGIIVPLGAALAGAALWLLSLGAIPNTTSGGALAVGAVLVALTFPFLVAERMMAGVSATRLPEAKALRALLLLPVLCVPVAGLLHAATGAGLFWAQPAMAALAVFLAVVAAELAVRALANWFLPPPPFDAARAAVASVAVLLLQPGRVASAGISAPLRTHLGLDFSRSWALRYLRSAALPVALLLLAFAWGLSGVALVGLDRRGIYERFGEPAAVWQPGIHLGLPWPLGRVRTVELGVVHAASLGLAASSGPPPPAEAPAVPEADRLWDVAHPAEASFLIAAADTAGTQGFQSVSVDLTVLYRTGLDDAATLRAAYAVATPDALVRAEAGRLLARFFAGQTLSAVLGGDRERLSGELRTALQEELDRLSAGMEVVAVVIEAIHPPAAAADAFHNVQAAEITATTAVSTERGRAQAATSLARQTTAETANGAGGAAAETVGRAEVLLRSFTADQAAAATGGEAFLLERYYGNLSAALARSPLVILDHRLGGVNAPIIDLRPLGAPKTTTDDD